MNPVSFEDKHWYLTVLRFTCAHKSRHFWWYQGPFYDSTEAAKERQIGLPAPSNQSFRWFLWWKFQDERYYFSSALMAASSSCFQKQFLYLQWTQVGISKWMADQNNRELIFEVGVLILQSSFLSFASFVYKEKAFWVFCQSLSMYFRSKLGDRLLMSGIVHVLARDEQS